LRVRGVSASFERCTVATGIHTSRDFESELQRLQAHWLAMGTRCEQGLRLSLEAFWQGSAELAADVEELDRQIDDDEKEIDALVLRILALRQPVAYDLRCLAGILRLVTDLERIGDEAVNIAERASEDVGAAREEVGEALRIMCEHAQRMLHEALDAFLRGEAACAQRVLVCDRSVDELHRQIVCGLTGYLATHPDHAAQVVRVIHVSKYLERVADHATNIAEAAIFVACGDDVQHLQVLLPAVVGPNGPPFGSTRQSTR
jgi:phosphate transport system protein